MSSDSPEVGASLLRQAASEQPLWLQTDGVSMLPTIRPRERVRVDPRPPRFGQVGAFVNGQGSVTVHRYLGRIRHRHLLLGDNRRDLDALVSDDQLVGSVVQLERDGEITALDARRARLARHAPPAICRLLIRRLRR